MTYQQCRSEWTPEGFRITFDIPCPECGGTGKVQEYQSRSDYMENGAPDPVTCGECKGTGWVRDE